MSHSESPYGGLFAPIEPLALSDTFYTWWQTTNMLSEALNPLALYDVEAGAGMKITRIEDNHVAVLSLELGSGLRFDTGVTVCLDIRNLQIAAKPDAADYFVFETWDGTNTTPSVIDSETLFKVAATDILPEVVAGDHDFTGGTSSIITISSDDFAVTSPAVTFLCDDILLGNGVGTDITLVTRSSIDSTGFRIPTLDEDPVWAFKGDLLAWYSNQNIGIAKDNAFVTDSIGGTAVFNFSTKTASQMTVDLNFLVGSRTGEITGTDSYGPSFTIRGNSGVARMDHVYRGADEVEHVLYFANYSVAENYTLFQIDGRIFIRDIEDSTQFLTTSNYTAHKVPITTTQGVLDHKFTNRFVTDKFHASLDTGHLVRLEFQNHTNTTEDIFLDFAQADTEENSKVFGIVEGFLSGNTQIVIALTGVFDVDPANIEDLLSGEIHYLSQTNPGETTNIKPTSGIVKEVFVGISSIKAVMTAAASNEVPNFANVAITGGDTVTADFSGDTLTLTSGVNITIEKTTNNEIMISAGTLAEADYWSTIQTDGASLTTTLAGDTLDVLGGAGITTSVSSGNLVITADNSYSAVFIQGMNTDELDYNVSANTPGDTLTFQSGIGIEITSDTDNRILFTATGTSVPGPDSVTNDILANMSPYSVKGAQSNGNPTDIVWTGETLLNFPSSYTVTGSAGSRVFTNTSTSVAHTAITNVSWNGTVYDGTPEDISGYLIGRVTATGGSISPLKAIGRDELRVLLGASETGFLEENGNAYAEWYTFINDGVGEFVTADIVNTDTSPNKGGSLVFLAGNNVTLTSIPVELDGAPLGDGIIISSTADNAFHTVCNATTGETFSTGDTLGIIEFVENSVIGLDFGTSTGIEIYVKENSITNAMLLSMPVNTVKIGNDNTDTGFDVLDLVIGENQFLGRLSGEELRSLNAAEGRQLLGLSSNTFFKTFTFAGSGSNTHLASTSETMTFVTGTGISFTSSANNSITISATGSTGPGVSMSLGLPDNAGQVYSSINKISMAHVEHTSGSLGSANIDIIDISQANTTQPSVKFDMSLMPINTVKVAVGSQTTRNLGTGQDTSYTGHIAGNLTIEANQVLGRKTADGLVSLSAEEAFRLGGGVYVNAITAGSGSITMSTTAGTPINFLGSGGTTVSASGTNITITSSSTAGGLLIEEATPTIKSDAKLNLNKTVIQTSSSVSGQTLVQEVLELKHQSSNTTTSAYKFVLDASSTTATGGVNAGPSISVASASGTNTSGTQLTNANNQRSLRLFGAANGGVEISRLISSALVPATSLIIGSNCTTDPGSAIRHIVLDSGHASEVIIGQYVHNIGTGTPTNTGNSTKNLVFVANSIPTSVGSKDIRTRFYNNTALIGDVIFRSVGTNIGIISTNNGNLILAANQLNPSDFEIPTNSPGKVQFNSEILMDNRAIGATNNEVVIKSTVDSFVGGLKLEGLTRAAWHKVKTFSSGADDDFADRIMDELPIENAAYKYILFLDRGVCQDNGDDTTPPRDVIMMEFNVMTSSGVAGTRFNTLSITDALGPKEYSYSNGFPVPQVGSMAAINEIAPIVLITPFNSDCGLQGRCDGEIIPDIFIPQAQTCLSNRNNFEFDPNLVYVYLSCDVAGSGPVVGTLYRMSMNSAS